MANREEEPVLSCIQASLRSPTDSGEEPKYDDVRRVQGDHSDWVFRAHREMWKKALAYYKEHKTVPIGDEFGNSPLQYEDE